MTPARRASSDSDATAGEGPEALNAERASMFTPALRVATLTLYVFFGSTPWSLTPMRYVALVASRIPSRAPLTSFVERRERPPVVST